MTSDGPINIKRTAAWRQEQRDATNLAFQEIAQLERVRREQKTEALREARQEAMVDKT